MMQNHFEMRERSYRTWLGRTLALTAALVVLTQLTSELQAGFREVVRKALPTTVYVECRLPAGKPAHPNADPAAGRAILPNPVPNAVAEREATEGLVLSSGTLISGDGLIVTVAEVNEAAIFSISLTDGRTFPARLLVDDQRNRLKLLKIDATDLPHLTIGNQPVEMGDAVVSTFCLNPAERGAGFSMVVATGRNVIGFGYNFIQLDARTAQMSAGGPLINEQGELSGIIALNQTSGAQTTSFAIPASEIPNLLKFRRENETVIVRRGTMGLALSQAPQGGSSVLANPTPESPAAAAGIQPGDVILEIDGAKARSPEDVARRAAQHVAGDVIKLRILRGDEEKLFEITMAPAPASKAQTIRSDDEAVAAAAKARLGAVHERYTQLTPPAVKNSAVEWGANPKSSPDPKGRPDIVYILKDGKLEAIPLTRNEKPAEMLREYHEEVARKLHQELRSTNPTPVPTVPSIQVQRSDVEKKLEEIGRDVLTLRQQMEKLTVEMQRLQEHLAELNGTPPKKN
jgi:S1-C subfamily serine protease